MKLLRPFVCPSVTMRKERVTPEFFRLGFSAGDWHVQVVMHISAMAGLAKAIERNIATKNNLDEVYRYTSCVPCCSIKTVCHGLGTPNFRLDAPKKKGRKLKLKKLVFHKGDEA